MLPPTPKGLQPPAQCQGIALGAPAVATIPAAAAAVAARCHGRRAAKVAAAAPGAAAGNLHLRRSGGSQAVRVGGHRSIARQALLQPCRGARRGTAQGACLAAAAPTAGAGSACVSPSSGHRAGWSRRAGEPPRLRRAHPQTQQRQSSLGVRWGMELVEAALVREGCAVSARAAALRFPPRAVAAALRVWVWVGRARCAAQASADPPAPRGQPLTASRAALDVNGQDAPKLGKHPVDLVAGKHHARACHMHVAAGTLRRGVAAGRTPSSGRRAAHAFAAQQALRAQPRRGTAAHACASAPCAFPCTHACASRSRRALARPAAGWSRTRRPASLLPPPRLNSLSAAAVMHTPPPIWGLG